MWLFLNKKKKWWINTVDRLLSEVSREVILFAQQNSNMVIKEGQWDRRNEALRKLFLRGLVLGINFATEQIGNLLKELYKEIGRKYLFKSDVKLKEICSEQILSLAYISMGSRLLHNGFDPERVGFCTGYSMMIDAIKRNIKH